MREHAYLRVRLVLEITNFGVLVRHVICDHHRFESERGKSTEEFYNSRTIRQFKNYWRIPEVLESPRTTDIYVILIHTTMSLP